MKVIKVSPGEVKEGSRIRQLKKSRLAELTESMGEIGLQSPITVWKYGGDQYGLVAGFHHWSRPSSFEIRCRSRRP